MSTRGPEYFCVVVKPLTYGCASVRILGTGGRRFLCPPPNRKTSAGGEEARLTGPQGSGILTSMVLANALLVIPEGQLETAVGATVQALVFHDSIHQEHPGF